MKHKSYCLKVPLNEMAFFLFFEFRLQIVLISIQNHSRILWFLDGAIYYSVTPACYRIFFVNKPKIRD